MAQNIGGISGESAANVTHNLRGIDFPCSKSQLLDQARKNGANQDVIKVINGLEDRQYQSMADVMQSYGKEKAA
jgi:hypothetical protein